MKIIKFETCGGCPHNRHAWCCNPQKNGERAIVDHHKILTDCPLATEAELLKDVCPCCLGSGFKSNDYDQWAGSWAMKRAEAGEHGDER